GVSTTAIQIGGAIGLAVLATIAATTTRNQAAGTETTDALSAGYTRAFQVGAVIISLAVPIALALLRLRPTTDTPQAESDRGEEDSRWPTGATSQFPSRCKPGPRSRRPTAVRGDRCRLNCRGFQLLGRV